MRGREPDGKEKARRDKVHGRATGVRALSAMEKERKKKNGRKKNRAKEMRHPRVSKRGARERKGSSSSGGGGGGGGGRKGEGGAAREGCAAGPRSIDPPAR